MSTAAPLLEFRAVTRRWRAGILGSATELTALDRCSFTLAGGEVLVVTGDAGAGKSTLLALAAGHAAPSDGQVLWSGLPDASRLRPQLVGPRPWEYGALTVRQALAFHADQLALQDLGIARRTRFVPLMTDVGLRGRSRVRLGQLAALDLLRVVLAQALLAGPRILCCEEPLAFLGPRERLEAGALLRGIAARGLGLLIATRDPAVFAELGIADRTLRLAAGRQVEDTPATRSVLELAVPGAADAMLRLSARLPSVTRRGRRLRVPLQSLTPEAVLSACRDAGVVVRASRVAEEPLPGRACDP